MQKQLRLYEWRDSKGVDAFGIIDHVQLAESWRTDLSDAPFRREDIEEVIAYDSDRDDEETHLRGVFKLRDGRYAYVWANEVWHDWHHVEATVATTLEALINDLDPAVIQALNLERRAT